MKNLFSRVAKDPSQHAKAKEAERPSTDPLFRLFEEAEGWHVDFVLSQRRSRNTAWMVAGVASLWAVCATTAVTAMAPLKTAVPYVFRVDQTTGRVDVVTAMTDGTTTYNETINKYFLNEYVRDRESYSRETIYSLFNRILLLSAPAEREKYKKLYDRSNQLSPLNTLGDSSRAEARISNISFLDKNVAAVRYQLVINKNGQPQPPVYMLATVTFGYNPAPMSESSRLENPLGFQVIDYRVDPEVIGNAPQANTQATPDAEAAQPTAVSPAGTAAGGRS